MNSQTRTGTSGRYRATAGPPATIRITQGFSTSPQRVFDAWLDPAVAGRWLFATASCPMTHVEIDARVEGLFRFVGQQNGGRFEHTGEYVEIVPHRRLVFTLAMDGHPHVITRVTVEIAPSKTGCKLTLTHENVPADCTSYTEARWTGVLYGLGVTFEATPLDELLASAEGRAATTGPQPA